MAVVSVVVVVDVEDEDEEVSGVIAAVGAGVVVIVVLVVVSVDLVVSAGVGLTMVVLFSVPAGAGETAGVVVSVFCSHAARSAALARMQMYFFIIRIGSPSFWTKAESKQPFFLDLLKLISGSIRIAGAAN